MQEINFELQGDYIHMIQLLKFLNLVSSGAEAKIVVEEGMVLYNGKVDYRKRLKVRKGDVVEFEDSIIRIL